MAVHLLIAFAVAAAWVLSLLVHPFGRCWLCGGKGNLRRSAAAGRQSARCARASSAASGSARGRCTASAAR